MITLAELIDKMKREEETFLLDLLQIRSEDLVERFADYIEARYEEFALEFDDTDYEEELTGELDFEDGHRYTEE